MFWNFFLSRSLSIHKNAHPYVNKLHFWSFVFKSDWKSPKLQLVNTCCVVGKCNKNYFRPSWNEREGDKGQDRWSKVGDSSRSNCAIFTCAWLRRASARHRLTASLPHRLTSLSLFSHLISAPLRSRLSSATSYLWPFAKCGKQTIFIDSLTWQSSLLLIVILAMSI